MLTYSEFKDVQEHNPLSISNIIKKINPLDKLQDKIKKRGLSGSAKDVLKKKIDKLNPLSDINKATTKAKKKNLKKMKANRTKMKATLDVLSKKINELEPEVQEHWKIDEDMCDLPKHKLSSKTMRATWEKKCGDKTPKKEKDSAMRRAGKKAGLSRKERDKLYNENEPNLDERQMSTPQKVSQMQHYWDDLDHLASDELKKKKMQMKFGIKNIKLDPRKGKILSFEEVEQQ